MSTKRQVYLLDPQKLNPETIAVTFAKTSRSPESFREIAAELTDEKSARFNEKWVVGYGHASVAEHAVLHIAVENISRLAVEALESNRLASYTEKSTRYQKWESERFFTPPELDNHPLQDLYHRTCRLLFQSYLDALPLLREQVAAECPQKDSESQATWEQRIRSTYVDVCRFLLPAASLANVGITANARTLEHAIRKMLSHPLLEVQSLGYEIKAVAQNSVPTLVKHAEVVPYLQQTNRDFASFAQHKEEPDLSPQGWCRLVSFDEQAEIRVLAAALYRYGNRAYAHYLDEVRNFSTKMRIDLGKSLLDQLGPHDIPLRELEYAAFTFDIILDQGAYFELKRHRMMTQTPQALSPYLGFALPSRFITTGLEKSFRSAMQSAREAYTQIASFNPDIASYLVPNACNRRVLLTFNLRTAMHLIALRTAPNAHFSIRRIAQRMADEICARLPLLGQYIRRPAEPWQEIEEVYFGGMNEY